MGTLSLTVSNDPLAVGISGPPVGFAGRSMPFAATVTRSPGDAGTLSYNWTVLNANGTTYADPNGNNTTGTLSTFVVPGSLPAGAGSTTANYQLRLTVTDGNGSVTAVATQTTDFAVMPAPSGANVLDWGSLSPYNLFDSSPEAGNPSAPLDPLTVTGVTQQADGKVVVIGTTNADHGTGWYLARFNADLTVDTSFGPNSTGVVTSPITGGVPDNVGQSDNYCLYGLTINPVNQDIVVVGSERVQDSLGLRPTVAEYLSAPAVGPGGTFLPAGAPDPNFNSPWF
jgi:hypothetical protein